MTVTYRVAKQNEAPSEFYAVAENLSEEKNGFKFIDDEMSVRACLKFAFGKATVTAHSGVKPIETNVYNLSRVISLLQWLLSQPILNWR